MKAVFILAALPLILSAQAANASATVVLDSNPIVADAVDGVYVNGFSYDVTFAHGIVDHTFDGMPDAQSTAETDLENALDASSVSYVHEPTQGSLNNFVVGNPSDGGTEVAYSGSDWQSYGSGSGNTSEAIFTPSRAPNVVLLNSQVVDAVYDLSVDGMLYNVTFQEGAVDTTFAGNAAEQAVAESELENALNLTTAAYVHEDGVGSINNFVVGDPSNGGIELISYGSVGQWQTNGSGSGNPSEAVFTAAPEPGTWAMMFMGLWGVGAALRRANRKTGATGNRGVGAPRFSSHRMAPPMVL